MDSLALPIARAAFPEPFPQGLEFNAPVRGPWNIVHMALAIPKAHLLYICARGCLRGVLMTAAEMGAYHRMSWVGLRECDLAAGTLDKSTLTSAKAVIARLPVRPPLVFVYLSCVHKFAALDYPTLLNGLSASFPDITWVGCHMMPTMRKSGPTDEERTRARMYDGLTDCAPQHKSISIIGNDWPLLEESVLSRMLTHAGFCLREIPRCTTYQDYLDLAKSATLLTTSPQALLAAEELSQRLHRRHIHCQISYSLEEIEQNLTHVAHSLDIPLPDLSHDKAHVSTALAETLACVGNRPITLDYTLTARPLSLARLLLEHGFSLTTLYLDAFSPCEEADYHWLREHAPTLAIHPTLAPSLRLAHIRAQSAPNGDTVLALGQKAAYFSGTNFFVNCVADGGLFDYAGICRLLARIREAHSKPKDRRTILQIKGLGLPSCLNQRTQLAPSPQQRVAGA